MDNEEFLHVEASRIIDTSNQVSNRKLKLLGKGGVILVAGGISNSAWGLAIGLNRYFEKTGGSTLAPAIGFAAISTAAEYGLTHAATAGDLDVEWNPTRRITNGIKKVISKFPLVVTSWRGAASGVVVDQISGREVTNNRRLAHAGLYGSIMGAWVSEPGSAILERGWEALNEVADRPALAATLGVAAIAGTIAGLRKVDTPELSQP